MKEKKNLRADQFELYDLKIVVEEINGNFEDLILINLHHHKQVSKTKLAYFDCILIA